jgi:hypothetical protein
MLGVRPSPPDIALLNGGRASFRVASINMALLAEGECPKNPTPVNITWLLHRHKSVLRSESYLPDRDGSPVEEVKRMI